MLRSVIGNALKYVLIDVNSIDIQFILVFLFSFELDETNNSCWELGKKNRSSCEQQWADIFSDVEIDLLTFDGNILNFKRNNSNFSPLHFFFVRAEIRIRFCFLILSVIRKSLFFHFIFFFGDMMMLIFLRHFSFFCSFFPSFRSFFRSFS